MARQSSCAQPKYGKAPPCLVGHAGHGRDRIRRGRCLRQPKHACGGPAESSEKLAARSAEVRRDYPQRGVLLAVAAVNAWKDARISPVIPAEQSLRDALQGVGGLPLSGHDGPITAVAVSPGGGWFVTASDDHSVRLWKISSRAPPLLHSVLSGHRGAVKSVAFSPDGHRLVTASLDGTARVWNVQALEPSQDVIVLPCQAPVLALAFSRDGNWLVTAGWDNTPRLWDLSSSNPSVRSKLLCGHTGHVVKLAADRNWLATAGQDGTVRLWNWREMAESWNANRDPQSPWLLDQHRAPITAIAFSPDGQTLASGSADGAVYRWTLSAEKPPIPCELKAHTSDVLAISFQR